MSISGSVIAGFAGLAGGEAIADQFIDDNNILGHVAIGAVGAGITASATKYVIDETGVGNLIDDIFGF